MLTVAAAAALILPGLALAAPLVARQAEGQFIRFQTTDICLTVQPGVNGRFSDGNAVISAKCGEGPFSLNGPTQNWLINRGAGAVRLAGTNFCLDAGSDPRNNIGMKIWTCYDGLANQNWYYTDDDRIAVTGDDQCLDRESSGRIQTYQCISLNTNQIFTTAGSGTPTPDPDPTPDPEPTPGASTIRFQDSDSCLTVQPGGNGRFSNGNTVFMAKCGEGPFSLNGPTQNWVINRGAGSVRLEGTNFCLDAGSNPGNGIQAKIWTCYDGLTNQNWYYTDDNRIAVTGGDQCLDRANGNGDYVQTWQCSTGNENQEWSA